MSAWWSDRKKEKPPPKALSSVFPQDGGVAYAVRTSAAVIAGGVAQLLDITSFVPTAA
jgi:hypothetical protein